MASDDPRGETLPNFAVTRQLASYTAPEQRPDITIDASVNFSDATLQCMFTLTGAVSDIVLPEADQTRRADELWRATCFELFLRENSGAAYQEFNISPAHGWNIYQFDTYRRGMRPVPIRREPQILSRRGTDFFQLSFAVADAAFLRQPSAVNLTVILRDRSGDLHYYAIDVSHTPPDFHNPDSFLSLV